MPSERQHFTGRRTPLLNAGTAAAVAGEPSIRTALDSVGAVPEDAPLPGMIGEHPLMKEVYRLVRRVAPTELPALIVGETGTGKELVARALHELSGRRGSFVDLNCAALPEHLVDGELFGWERGAFTGAHRQVPGLLELADGGTLFLDEACSLPVLAQAKLLRALERGEHRRVGGRVVVRANFRLVLAFSEEPEVLVPRGKLRLDFFCRVSDAPIRLPPLRARGSDIQLLAAAFLAEAVGDRRRFTTEALARLAGCRWPGNVRELRQLVARLAVFTGGAEITERDLLGWTNGQGLLATREDLERALALHGGDVSKAARALGMPRSTFRSRLGHARRQNGNVHQGGDRH